MRKFIFLLTIGLITISNASGQIPVAADPVFTNKLNDLEHSGDLLALFSAIRKINNEEQFKAALDWFQQRALYTENPDPRYLLTYATLLDAARTRDSSAWWYLATKLVAQVEAAGCADSSAPAPKLYELEGQTWRFEKNFWSLLEAQRQAVLDAALKVEATKDLGKPNRWLSSGGRQDQQSKLKMAVDEGKASGITRPRDDVVAIDASDIEPRYVPDSDIRQIRKAIREAFVRKYSGSIPGTAR